MEGLFNSLFSDILRQQQTNIPALHILVRKRYCTGGFLLLGQFFCLNHVLKKPQLLTLIYSLAKKILVPQEPRGLVIHRCILGIGLTTVRKVNFVYLYLLYILLFNFIVLVKIYVNFIVYSENRSEKDKRLCNLICVDCFVFC